MKRIGSVLLIMILVSGIFCGAAFADDKKGKEVTFLDIPWESSIEDTVALLKDKGVIVDIAQKCIPTENWLIDGSQNGNLLNSKCAIMWSTEYSAVLQSADFYKDVELTDYEIGGYVISNMELLFMNDGDNSKLISVCVYLETPSGYDATKDVFPNIKEKLESVYGKLKKVSCFGYRGYSYKGNNNAGVCLMNLADNGGWITLVYGRTDAVDLLKEAMKSVRDSNPDLSTTNTNGL